MTMAILTEWSVPHPFGHVDGPFLRFLTPETNGSVFYTKSKGDFVGELDVTKNTVREWAIPWSGKPDGVPQNIKFSPSGHLWFVLSGASALVQLDPLTGIFTAYFVQAWPQDFMFDSLGHLWFSGDTLPSAATGIIARLTLTPVGVQYWIIPPITAGLKTYGLSPNAIWVDSSNTVWISNANMSQMTPGPCFASIAQSQFTYWSMPSLASPFNTSSPGLVVDPQAQNVWVTLKRQSLSDAVIFKYNVSNKQCLAYPNPNPNNPINPRQILLDSQGKAWFADTSPNGGIGAIEANPMCGTPQPIQSQSFALQHHIAEARIETRQVMPVSAVSVPVGTDLNVASNGCYREFLFPPRPGLLPTGSLALNPGKVYFCETRPDTNVIGCLTI